MASAPLPDPQTLGIDGPSRAVAIYLGIAYPDGDYPARVQQRIDWGECASLADLLGLPCFERSVSASPGNGDIYSLRLGNHLYPHMKLQLQRWPTATGYLLSVNSHDQVGHYDASMPGFAAFQALQKENQRIKDAIENEWDRQGLPTFRRYLLDYIAQNGLAGGAEGSAEVPLA